MLENYPDVLEPSEVAEILRIKEYKVYKLIREKKIPSLNVGKPYRILKKCIEDILRGIDNDLVCDKIHTVV